MLAVDINKTLHWSPDTFLSANQNAPFAGLRGIGDYYTEGKLQQGLRGLRGYQVFAYDPGAMPGLGGYQVFAYDPAVSPGLGWISKNQPALGDCGCGCGGMGTCLGDDYYSSSISGLGFTMPDGGDFDISSLLPTSGGSGGGIANTMAAIAQFDPEPISGTALRIAAGATQFVASVEGFLGIGAGRREADQIVPIQNKVNYEVLAPAYSEMGQGTALNCASIATMYMAVFKAWQQWLHFLHDTQWSDGRAAQGAEATLAPYFNTILGSNAGAPGQYEKGGFEQIFEAKNCGSWLPAAGGTGMSAVAPTITTAPVYSAAGVTGLFSSASIQKYLPYALIGGALFALTRAKIF